MEQKKFSVLLKVIITGAVICCVLVYALIVPAVGHSLVEAGGEEFAPYYLPWYLFVLGTALPIAAAAVLAWLIAGNIGRDRSFSRENAKYLSVIAILAAADAAYFFIPTRARAAIPTPCASRAAPSPSRPKALTA